MKRPAASRARTRTRSLPEAPGRPFAERAGGSPEALGRTRRRGRTLFDGEAIRRGQGVWQSLGGQEIGSIWGHGAYVAPDWTADFLHREWVLILDAWARAEGSSGYEALPDERRAALRARLERTTRTANVDAAGTGWSYDPRGRVEEGGSAVVPPTKPREVERV